MEFVQAIICDLNSLSDSSVPNYRVVSKSIVVSIKPFFNNPSIERSSKSTSYSKKKPWLNKRDIFHPNTEVRKDLEKETRSRQCFRFLEKSNKIVFQKVASLTTRNHNIFVPAITHTKPFVSVNSNTHDTSVNHYVKSVNVETPRKKRYSPQEISFPILNASSDGKTFKP